VCKIAQEGGVTLANTTLVWPQDSGPRFDPLWQFLHHIAKVAFASLAYVCASFGIFDSQYAQTLEELNSSATSITLPLLMLIYYVTFNTY